MGVCEISPMMKTMIAAMLVAGVAALPLSSEWGAMQPSFLQGDSADVQEGLKSIKTDSEKVANQAAGLASTYTTVQAEDKAKVEAKDEEIKATIEKAETESKKVEQEILQIVGEAAQAAVERTTEISKAVQEAEKDKQEAKASVSTAEVAVQKEAQEATQKAEKEKADAAMQEVKEKAAADT